MFLLVVVKSILIIVLGAVVVVVLVLVVVYFFLPTLVLVFCKPCHYQDDDDDYFWFVGWLFCSIAILMDASLNRRQRLKLKKKTEQRKGEIYTNALPLVGAQQDNFIQNTWMNNNELQKRKKKTTNVLFCSPSPLSLVIITNGNC